jgi:glycosyltransferase involved in cell wall biosynthesis
LKIAFISTVFTEPWAGSEELWYQTSLRCLERGHQVMASLFEKPCSCHQIENFQSHGGKLHWRKRFRNGRLHVLKHSYVSAFRQVFKSKPDVVILSLGSMMDLTLQPDLLRELQNTPAKVILLFLFNSDCILPDDNARAIIASFCQRANHLIFVSKHNWLLAERQIALKFNKVSVFSGSISYTDKYEKLPWLANDTLEMACVARFAVQEKGQDILIESLAQPQWKSRNWRLNIFGLGRDEYLRQLINHFNLTDRVRFRGYVTDTRDIWRENQMMVLASRAEGLSLAVLEAMICGRVCVVTDVGGHGEVITDSQSGFLAEAPQPKYFGRALERAWSMKEKLSEIGQNAHEAALKNFSETPDKKLLYLIEHILCTVTNCAFVISTIGEILNHLNKISPIVEMTKKLSL